MGEKWRALFRMRHQSFGRKIGFTIAVPIILFILAILINNTLLTQVNKNVDEVVVQGDLSIEVTELGSLYSSKYVQVSEYVILHLQQKINQYELLSREFDRTVEELKSKITNDNQMSLMNKVIQNNHKMDDLFRKDLIPKVKGERYDEAIKAMEPISGLRSVTLENTKKLKEMMKEQREASITSAENDLGTSRLVLIISAVIATVLGGATAFFVIRRMIANLKRVVAISNQIAQGNLVVERTGTPSHDEIGQLYESVHVMSDNLRHMTKHIIDVTTAIDIQREELTRFTQELKAGSEQIVMTMEQLSDGTEEQANSATDISASIELFSRQITAANQESIEMRSSSDQALRNAISGKTRMESFVVQMELINEIVMNSVTKVRQLDERTQDIKAFVEVIKEIANQTNLLSLNAAIEAARAGDAGAGFSVVAKEVRDLSIRTNEYVTKITDIMQGIQRESNEVVKSLQLGFKEVEQGMHKMKETGSAFSLIYDAVSDTVEHIQTSSERMSAIAERSMEINELVEQIAAVSQETAAGTEQTSASAQQQNAAVDRMNQSLAHLNHLAEGLQQTVQKFKV